MMAQTKEVSSDACSKEDLKAFLEKLEASGYGIHKVDPHQAVLNKDAEEEHPRFGVPGSEKRRSVLRKFYQLRRNSLLNYRKYLESFV